MNRKMSISYSLHRYTLFKLKNSDIIFYRIRILSIFIYYLSISKITKIHVLYKTRLYHLYNNTKYIFAKYKIFYVQNIITVF